MGHISDAISPTYFILGTKVQANRAHSMTQVSMTLTQGQFFPKMGKKPKNWSYLRGYFTYRLHIWYQGTTQLDTFNYPSADDLDLCQRSRSNSSKNG